MDLTDLPEEIFEFISMKLCVKDVLNCSLVNSKWRSCFNSDRIWHRFCRIRRPHLKFDKFNENTIEESFRGSSRPELNANSVASGVGTPSLSGADRVQEGTDWDPSLPPSSKENGPLEPMCDWKKEYRNQTKIYYNWRHFNFSTTDISTSTHTPVTTDKVVTNNYLVLTKEKTLYNYKFETLVVDILKPNSPRKKIYHNFKKVIVSNGVFIASQNNMIEIATLENTSSFLKTNIYLELDDPCGIKHVCLRNVALKNVRSEFDFDGRFLIGYVEGEEENLYLWKIQRNKCNVSFEFMFHKKIRVGFNFDIKFKFYDSFLYILLISKDKPERKLRVYELDLNKLHGTTQVVQYINNNIDNDKMQFYVNRYYLVVVFANLAKLRCEVELFLRSNGTHCRHLEWSLDRLKHFNYNISRHALVFGYVTTDSRETEFVVEVLDKSRHFKRNLKYSARHGPATRTTIHTFCQYLLLGNNESFYLLDCNRWSGDEAKFHLKKFFNRRKLTICWVSDNGSKAVARSNDNFYLLDFT